MDRNTKTETNRKWRVVVERFDSAGNQLRDTYYGFPTKEQAESFAAKVNRSDDRHYATTLEV